MIITVMKKVHRLHRFTQIIKRQKYQCNLCNLWASFFSSSPGADARHHKELPEE